MRRICKSRPQENAWAFSLRALEIDRKNGNDSAGGCNPAREILKRPPTFAARPALRQPITATLASVLTIRGKTATAAGETFPHRFAVGTAGLGVKAYS